MKTKKNIIWILFFIGASVWILTNSKKNSVYQENNGIIFGTIYQVTYQHNKDLKDEIDKELNRFDSSLSPFNKESVISKINNNQSVKLDTLFTNCFTQAMNISKKTKGAFDITVAPLVNAWGFGFKENNFPTKEKIDSIKKIIGYKKVTLKKGKIMKSNPNIMIDCSAIAKGYAVDVVANLLREKGIENFMVNIGGEIVLSGRNKHKRKWRIGVNKPINDSLSVNQDIQTTLELTDIAIATSGNYRNFYYKDGKKYAHTIDPRTGYPVQHSILSATVVAKDCMTADALATAFMVMGLQKAKLFINKNNDIEAYFIYANKNGETKTFFTKGLKKAIKR